MRITNPAGPQPPGDPRPLPGPGRLCIAMTLPPWYDVPPRAYGGIEALVAYLVDALVARGHDVVMVAAGTNGTRARFLRTFEEPQSDRLGEAMPEVLQAVWANRYLKDHDNIDIVHDHSLVGPLTASGRQVPTVLTAHGACTGEMHDYYRLPGPDVHLVAISDAQRRLSPDLSWEGMVHNAIKVGDYPFRSNKDDYVLFVGRFNPDKGAHLAIESARRAGRRILLAGKVNEGYERAYFDEEIRPRLGAGVEFLGEAEMARKQELYGAAHCLMFPVQWDEPFGMVMIESMACGTPVVALRRGSVPEVVADGVTGIIKDDPAELAGAIDAAGRLDPRACRDHVARHFDVSNMAEAYERVYRQVIRDHLVAAAAHVGNVVPSVASRPELTW
ncbi:glycosyltransferase family 4 protein [Actinomadura sp. HBU206391]|uniref:glycosyltransferase family 4 protein n=1 Tax=Actinomadura sp. HBU206391 TaxID=2731692 RepID=UPI00164FC9BF|nr:glycosyltransferase family 4 protein [Actinomadura sp. HBU206391]MBC6460147.1 glycosyltransferase family 4 protein [Actinomadura sp. HBU206391]